jgi:hypothetical protein
MPCPSRPPWLDHSKYTWRRVHVTKLFFFFPPSVEADTETDTKIKIFICGQFWEHLSDLLLIRPTCLSELRQRMAEAPNPPNCVYGGTKMIEVTGDDENVHRHARPRVWTYDSFWLLRHNAVVSQSVMKRRMRLTLKQN